MPPPGWRAGRLQGPWAKRPPAREQALPGPRPGWPQQSPRGLGEQGEGDRQQGGIGGPRGAQGPASHNVPGSARTRRRAPLGSRHPRRAPARPEPWPQSPRYPTCAAGAGGPHSPSLAFFLRARVPPSFPKKESSFFLDGGDFGVGDLGTEGDFCGEVAMAAERAAAGRSGRGAGAGLTRRARRD